MPSLLKKKNPISPVCRHTPAGTSFPLFGVGQANPLRCHSADVVACVKVGLLNLASIYHINNVIYGDAVRESGEREREREEGDGEKKKGGWNKDQIGQNKHFKAVGQECIAETSHDRRQNK